LNCGIVRLLCGRLISCASLPRRTAGVLWDAPAIQGSETYRRQTAQSHWEQLLCDSIEFQAIFSEIHQKKILAHPKISGGTRNSKSRR
jgi:hypothetical protein